MYGAPGVIRPMKNEFLVTAVHRQLDVVNA
jgi:hypothetical protein